MTEPTILEASVRDGILVVRLEGEIDLSNSRELRASLLREMSNSLLGLIIDLTDVTYLDSAGIRAIFELREDLDTRGQEIRLVVPRTSIVATALDLVDARGSVGIFSDTEAALDEVSRA
jgi:anti-sigma B factor antagonist/stage II sporulation protein AA (anti-sigma F factor antagonist)